jgi:EAL domain-containing protein (putative c-di-GMP-specific phosphodiesterase class I)
MAQRGTDAANVVPLFDGAAVLERLERQADQLELAYRPLVDLTAGTVAGWEALAALPGETPATPCEWSDRGRVRFAEAVEAQLLELMLPGRVELPPGGLLTITLSARALVSAPVQQVLVAAGAALEGIVLAIVDGPEPHDSFAIAAALEGARQAGARIALEEVAPSYPSMRQTLRIAPDYIRAAAALVEDVDRDPARATALEMLVALGRRIDADVIVDGIARPEELETASRLGVALAQGPIVGHPAPAMIAIPSVVAHAIARRAEPKDFKTAPAPTIAQLVETVVAMPAGVALAVLADAFLEDAENDYLVLLDDDDHPVAVADRAALLRAEPYEHAVLAVTADADARDVARTAIGRPPLERYAPVVCCDASGECLGIVRFERLVEALSG